MGGGGHRRGGRWAAAGADAGRGGGGGTGRPGTRFGGEGGGGFDEVWRGAWPARTAGALGLDDSSDEQGDEAEGSGQNLSLWEAELTAMWEAEAAGRFVGFGRAGEEDEGPRETPIR